MKKYVIIGNSAAAIGAVEGIRKNDKSGKITIISSEPYHTYSRPLISYLISGKTDEEKMKYRPAHFYEENMCDTIFGKSAESIDKEKKEVLLSDGEKIKYDKLLLATGSSPFVPKTDGYENVSKKFTFMSLDDAKNLAAQVRKKSKVLIIGAGLIGLKCAECLYDKCAEITVVDMSDHILPSILDKECSIRVQKVLEEHKITFILGTSVKKYDDGKAELQNGNTVDFDILVTSVGVRANTSLIADIGGKTERGIKINTYGETSIPDIYAAGDCAEGFDFSIGKDRVLAIMPNAYLGGECAGSNMSGKKTEFANAVPMNSIGFFGYHIMTAGSYEGECIEKHDGDNLKRFYILNGFLKGYMLLGDVRRGGIYTSLIRNAESLADIDTELLFENPGLICFSEKKRSKILGGVV